MEMAPPPEDNIDEYIAEGLDARIRDIQPGGGVVIALERSWGSVRRWWLKTFRRGYVRRMAQLRQGEPHGVPHPVLDPRDLKLYRNQTECHWREEDDPFRWRDALPFARCGLAEVIVFTGCSLLAVVLLFVLLLMTSSTILRVFLGSLVAVVVVIEGLILWFFRNPKRMAPLGEHLVVSPADGTIAGVREIDHAMLGGKAVEIGIFLSIFNVHINRMPLRGKILGIRYQPGKYLNALRPESERENEQISLLCECPDPASRRFIVRQITGAIARRIVCWVRPEEELARGEQFGMIKLGSRTVLVLPREEGLEIRVRPGDKVKAGETIVASYETTG